jgi:hypothetical protein
MKTKNRNNIVIQADAPQRKEIDIMEEAIKGLNKEKELLTMGMLEIVRGKYYRSTIEIENRLQQIDEQINKLLDHE